AERYRTVHHKIRIPTAELLAELPATIAAMSEPMVSYDNVGFFLLSREVAKHMKVVQSGQGADEVFAGYHWYPKMAESAGERAVESYARAFFDRDHAEYLRTIGAPWAGEDASRAFVERHFARAEAGTP